MPRCTEKETIAEAVQRFFPATSLSDLDNWRAAATSTGSIRLSATEPLAGRDRPTYLCGRYDQAQTTGLRSSYQGADRPQSESQSLPRAANPSVNGGVADQPRLLCSFWVSGQSDGSRPWP